MKDRASVPPAVARLADATDRLRKSNERFGAFLEEPTAQIPTPAPPAVELSDAQRLQVVREVWALAKETGASDGFQLLYEYERRIKEGSR